MKTAFYPGEYRCGLPDQGRLKLLPDWPVYDEVSGAVDGQKEVVEPDGDLYPDFVPHAGAEVVVLVQLWLVEILGEVEDQPGDVTDDVHHHDGRQCDGGVSHGATVVMYLLLSQHEDVHVTSLVTWSHQIREHTELPSREHAEFPGRGESDGAVVTLGGGGDAGGGDSLSPEGEIDGEVGHQEEQYRQHASPERSRPVDVVENVVGVQSERGRFEVPHLDHLVGGVRHVGEDQLQLEELGNVERDGEDDSRQDEDGGVPPARESQPGLPVPQRPRYGHQTLQGDAHQQVTLTRHQDVLQGVEEVGEHQHVHLGLNVDSVVADDQDEEHDLKHSEGDETLVEGWLHVGVAEDHHGSQVTHQSHTAHYRDGDLLQYELGPDVLLREGAGGAIVTDCHIETSDHQRASATTELDQHGNLMISKREPDSIGFSFYII